MSNQVDYLLQIDSGHEFGGELGITQEPCNILSMSASCYESVVISYRKSANSNRTRFGYLKFAN